MLLFTVRRSFCNRKNRSSCNCHYICNQYKIQHRLVLITKSIETIEARNSIKKNYRALIETLIK